MILLKTKITLSLLVLLIVPITAYAFTVNDNFTTTDDERGNTIPIFTPWENIRTELNLR